MAEEQGYQGWKNYETWAVALWIGNDEPTYRYWRQQAAKYKREAPADERVLRGHWTVEEAAKFNLADELKESFEGGAHNVCDDAGVSASVWADLLSAALSEVDWHAVAEAQLEE